MIIIGPFQYKIFKDKKNSLYNELNQKRRRYFYTTIFYMIEFLRGENSIIKLGMMEIPNYRTLDLLLIF